MSDRFFDPQIPDFQPEGDGGFFKKIIKIVKSLIGIFQKPSKEIGKTDSINDNSSLENIDHITKVFSDFKEQARVKSSVVEQSLLTEVNYYTEELRQILDQDIDKGLKYGIHFKRIERQIDKIASGIKGVIDNELLKIVSLDNKECRDIVKMIPGSKKEEEMNLFLEKAMNQSLRSACRELRERLNVIYEDVEGEVLGAIEMVGKQSESNRNALSQIEEGQDSENVKNVILADAYFCSNLCDMVLERI